MDYKNSRPRRHHAMAVGGSVAAPHIAHMAQYQATNTGGIASTFIFSNFEGPGTKKIIFPKPN